MAQQTLESLIVIKGSVDSSANSLSRYLDGLSDRMLTLGSFMNQMSAPMLQLGKESAALYSEFEDHMLYIQGLGELTGAQMKQVSAAAREAGATTRYTASQAAQALEDNAVAGLHYAESIELLGTELNMASAGNMELEVASSQLLSALSITGTSVADADGYVDKLAKTAASSKSDMEGLGEAVERLGATMGYLNGGTTEMFTMFGELGNLGAEGAEMGTWARNVLLSLIAPTQKSAEVMEELGYSVEEVEDALGDLDTGESARLIEKLGLEVYDEDTGELRNVFDILTDLNTALGSLTSEERSKAMATIFNKRTLGYAEGLMKVAASGEWRELFKTIDDSDGYAERVAARRESGLGGALRILKSQAEEVQLTLGEILSPQIQEAAGSVGDMFMAFTSLDEETKVRVVAVMEVLAGAGPAMLAVGSGLKVLAFAVTPAGMITLATVGFIALAKAMHDVADVRFSENFGEAELDMEALGLYVDGLSGQFNAVFEETRAFADEAETALENYRALKTEFSGNLMTQLVQGGKLEESDRAELEHLGTEALKAVMDGVQLNTASSMAYMDVLMGDSDDPQRSSAFAGLIEALNADYESTEGRLEELGGELNAVLQKAMTEGWTEEVQAEVKSVFSAADAEVEKQKQYLLKVEQQKLLNKAGYVTQDSANEYFGMLGGRMSEDLAEYDELFETNYARAQLGGADQTALDELRRAYEEDRAGRVKPYSDAAKAALDAVFTNSGLSEEYAGLKAVLSGESTMAEYGAQFADNASDVFRMLDMMQPLTKALAQTGLASDEAYKAFQGGEGFWAKFTGNDTSEMKRSFQTAVEGYYVQQANERFQHDMQAYHTYDSDWTQMLEEQTRALGEQGGVTSEMQRRFNEEMDYYYAHRPPNKIRDYFTGGKDLGEYAYGNDSSKYESGVKLGLAQNGEQLAGDIQQTLDRPYTAPNIGAETGQMEGDILSVTDIMRDVPLDADMARIYSKIHELESRPIKIPAKVEVSGGGMPGYADGGRADSPSIFGEAGAEWAIPERHTPRTADLITRAAKASGFSLTELAARAAGLNGRTGSAAGGAGSTQVVFSPQITVSDSRGIAGAMEAAQQSFFERLRREQIISSRVKYRAAQ